MLNYSIMDKAKVLTNLSILVGVLGAAALIFAWLADLRGFFLGFMADHWYSDALVFMLAAIWLKLGAIYHRKAEL